MLKHLFFIIFIVCFSTALVACGGEEESSFAILGLDDTAPERTDFGTVYAGAESTQLVQVINDGKNPVVLDALPPLEAPFSVASTTCTTDLELSPCLLYTSDAADE